MLYHLTLGNKQKIIYVSSSLQEFLGRTRSGVSNFSSRRARFTENICSLVRLKEKIFREP